MGVLSDIVSGIGKPVSDYFNRRQELKAEQYKLDSEERVKMHELKMAEMDRHIELKRQGLTADLNWEMEFARQASSSWKDEYTLIVVSIPAVLAFIPGGSDIVSHGFDALEKTPGWYQLLLLTLFMATVGIRYWRRTQSDT